MSLTEDDKQARPQEYGFNPVSRRWVKRVSDVWLRLVKSGVVGETPEYLSDLAAARRDVTRKKNDLAFERFRRPWYARGFDARARNRTHSTRSARARSSRTC